MTWVAKGQYTIEDQQSENGHAIIGRHIWISINIGSKGLVANAQLNELKLEVDAIAAMFVLMPGLKFTKSKIEFGPEQVQPFNIYKIHSVNDFYRAIDDLQRYNNKAMLSYDSHQQPLLSQFKSGTQQKDVQSEIECTTCVSRLRNVFGI